jgi:cytoskeleton protein RodZ
MNAVGEIFRSARQQRNLSIDEVSKLTKIGVRVVESIEHGNFQALPPTYMRSFVRTYSQFLNIPEPELHLGDKPEAERFQAKHTEQISPLAMPENVFTPAYFSDSKRRNQRILASIYGVVGCLLAVVGYLVWIAPHVPKKADDTILTRPLRILAEAVKPSSLRDSAAISFVQNSDSMILEARAIENAWLSIVMDKKRTEQFTMEAGKIYRWSAARSFSFSLGNAGGVSFTLNGRTLEQFGEKGVVVRDIRISRDAARGTVISSSSNPALARILEAVPNQTVSNQTVSNQSVPSTNPQNVNSSPPSSSSSPSSSNIASPNTAATLNQSALVKGDSVKPRPRLVNRSKPQQKTLIDPVVPTLAPPKLPTTVFKPVDGKTGRNN